MRRLARVVAIVALAVWAWRRFFARPEASERATVSYGDGSSVVLEPGSDAFERLASIARGTLRS